GNSGTVLYGDGAIGGVINIVLKKGSSPQTKNQIEALAGSFRYGEGRISAGTASGPWSLGLFGNTIYSDGYRVNSALRQQNGTTPINYNPPTLGGYFTCAGDRQYQGLPGGLRNVPNGVPYLIDTPWQSDTPLDWGRKQGLNFTAGVNGTIAPG